MDTVNRGLGPAEEGKRDNGNDKRILLREGGEGKSAEEGADYQVRRDK